MVSNCLYGIMIRSGSAMAVEFLTTFVAYSCIAVYFSISACIALGTETKHRTLLFAILLIGSFVWPLLIGIVLLACIGYFVFAIVCACCKPCATDSDLETYPVTDSIAIDLVPLQTQYEIHFIGQEANQRIYEEDMCCICHGQLCYNGMTSHSRQRAACDRVCDVIQPDDCCLLSCGHIHHVECLMEWLQIKQQCPQCKTTQLLSNCKLVRSRHEEIQIAAVH